MQQEHQEPNDNHRVPPPTAHPSSSLSPSILFFSFRGSSKFHRGVPRPAWNVRKGVPFGEHRARSPYRAATPFGSPYPCVHTIFSLKRHHRGNVPDSSMGSCSKKLRNPVAAMQVARYAGSRHSRRNIPKQTYARGIFPPSSLIFLSLPGTTGATRVAGT